MEEEKKTIITRKLKGTSFTVVLVLDQVEYQHFLLAEGRRPGVSMPMDINMMREMTALATHFERPRPYPVVEDEARDAMEMAGGL